MTTTFIDRANDLLVEDRAHHFSACASDLGLRPGQWPATIDTNLGNGQPLVKRFVTEGAVTYRQQLGCIDVTLFND